MKRHWFTQEWNDAEHCPGPTPRKDWAIGVLNSWRLLWWRYADGYSWECARLFWVAWYWYDWTEPEGRR